MPKDVNEATHTAERPQNKISEEEDRIHEAVNRQRATTDQAFSEAGQASARLRSELNRALEQSAERAVDAQKIVLDGVMRQQDVLNRLIRIQIDNYTRGWDWFSNWYRMNTDIVIGWQNTLLQAAERQSDRMRNPG